MPGQQEIIKIILPAIIRLFPELIKGEMTVGKIIPLFKVKEETDQEALRNLARKLRVKPRQKFNDNTHIVKISDAKKCIEDQLIKDKTFFLQFVTWACKNIIGAGSGRLDNGPMQVFIDKIVDCMRDKALKQTAKRKRITYTYPKREI